MEFDYYPFICKYCGYISTQNTERNEHIENCLGLQPLFLEIEDKEIISSIKEDKKMLLENTILNSGKSCLYIIPFYLKCGGCDYFFKDIEILIHICNGCKINKNKHICNNFHKIYFQTLSNLHLEMQNENIKYSSSLSSCVENFNKIYDRLKQGIKYRFYMCLKCMKIFREDDRKTYGNEINSKLDEEEEINLEKLFNLSFISIKSDYNDNSNLNEKKERKGDLNEYRDNISSSKLLYEDSIQVCSFSQINNKNENENENCNESCNGSSESESSSSNSSTSSKHKFIRRDFGFRIFCCSRPKYYCYKISLPFLIPSENKNSTFLEKHMDIYLMNF
jgi:hypothetical protein